jgi:hypothetical protein
MSPHSIVRLIQELPKLGQTNFSTHKEGEAATIEECNAHQGQERQERRQTWACR